MKSSEFEFKPRVPQQTPSLPRFRSDCLLNGFIPDRSPQTQSFSFDRLDRLMDIQPSHSHSGVPVCERVVASDHRSFQTYVRLNAALMSNPSSTQTSETERNLRNALEQPGRDRRRQTLSHRVQSGQSYSCQTGPWKRPHTCRPRRSQPWLTGSASQTCRPAGDAAADVRAKNVEKYNSRSLNCVSGHQSSEVSLSSTLLWRSYDSFSCRCFPDLLARSIHFPLNHLTEGFFSSDSAFTLARNVMFCPAQINSFDWVCKNKSRIPAASPFLSFPFISWMLSPLTYGDLSTLRLLCEESSQVLPGVRRVSVCQETSRIISGCKVNQTFRTGTADVCFSQAVEHKFLGCFQMF